MDIKDKLLNRACRDGDLEKVTEYMNQGADVNNANDQLGRSPLIFAAEYSENLDIIEALIAKGAVVNYSDQRKTTALQHFISTGNIEGIKLLLENGSDPNHSSSLDDVPMEDEKEFAKILELLIDSGLNFKNFDIDGEIVAGEALIKFIELNNDNLLQKLIRANANIEYFDRLGYSPLMVAADSGNLKLCKLLIENNADIENGDKGKCKPIMVAASRGNIDVVKYLVQHDCNYKAQDEDGWDAIRYAKEAEDGPYEEVINFLSNLKH
jgi:ankyrin repeat protein